MAQRKISLTRRQKTGVVTHGWPQLAPHLTASFWSFVSLAGGKALSHSLSEVLSRSF